MENYGKAVDYAEDALDSAGTAEQKFGAYTEGVEAKMNSMKASLEGWATNLIDSDLIKGIIDATTGLIKFADTFKIVQILFIGLMAIGIPKLFLAMVKSLSKASASAVRFVATQKGVAMEMGKTSTATQALNNLLTYNAFTMQNMSQGQILTTLTTTGLLEAFRGLTKEEIINKLATMGVSEELQESTAQKILNQLATNGQTISIKALTQATWLHIKAMVKEIATMIAAHPVISAITGLLMGLVIVLVSVANAEKKLNEDIAETTEKYNEAKSSLEQINSALEKNEERIKELNSLPSRTYVEDEELAKLKETTKELEAQKELQEQEEASSAEALYALQEEKINKLGDFDSEYASTTYEEDIKNKEAELLELQKIKEQINQELAESRGNYSETLSKYPDIEQKMQGLVDQINKLSSLQLDTSGTEVTGLEEQVKKYNDLTNQINNTTDAQERLDLISQRSGLFTQENGLADKLQIFQDQIKTLNEMSDTSIEAVFGSKEAWEEKKKELQNKYDEIYKILFPENYKSTKWEEVLGMDEFEGATEKLQEWVNAGLSEEEILKKLKETYPNLIAKLKEFGIQEDEIINQFKKEEDASKKSGEAAKKTAEEFEKLKEEIEAINDAYETLNSAIEEYNSNGSISYDTWEELINLEDKYLSVLVDEEGQIKANNKALQDLMKTKIEDATLTRMETYVNNLLAAAQQGNLDEILLSTKGLEDNTNARLQNIMAIIAFNPELMKNSKAILQNLSAMAQLTSSISLGSDSTKDAKDATEDWEKVLDYANTILDEQIEKLEKEQETLEKLTEEKIKAHEAEIKRLEEEKELLEEKNDEKNKEIELEKLKANLQKAKQRTMRVYYADKGWVWEQDPEAIQEAQQELDDFYTEQKIDNIDKQIEAEEKKIEELEDGLDKEIKSYEERIRKIEEYKKKWEKVPKDYEKTQNEIAAKAQLGADAEKKILVGIDGKGGRLKALEDFKVGYTKALGTVATETEKSANRVNTALGSFNFEKMTEMLNDALKKMNLAGTVQSDLIFDGRNRGTVMEKGASGIEFMKIGTNQWVKKSDSKHLGGSGYQIKKGTQIYAAPYASGTLSAKSGLANVDEKGNELIIPKQGRYRMMEYGDTVVPHNLSQRLFDVASNPLRFIANALNSVKTPNLMSNSSRISNASTISIGTIELPSVTNGESFIKQLQLIAANR